ncbi:hypothetical protein D9M71_756500 [compost metagenome]
MYGTVVTSPAANTPGMLVWPLASTMISPRGDNSTVPFNQSVFGSKPICTKMPSSATSCCCSVVRSL